MPYRRGTERIICEGKPAAAVESWSTLWYCSRCGDLVQKPVQTGDNRDA